MTLEKLFNLQSTNVIIIKRRIFITYLLLGELNEMMDDSQLVAQVLLSSYFSHSWWVLNFPKCFLCINRYNQVVFSYSFGIGIRLNQPCIPGRSLSWWWHIILFIYCRVLFANILLRDFASIFMTDIGLLLVL